MKLISSMNSVVLITASFLVSGCASPQSSLRSMPAATQATVDPNFIRYESSASLCASFIGSANAPSNIRELWWSELYRRSENCAAYAPAAGALPQDRSDSVDRTIQALRLLNAQFNRAPQPAPAQPTAFFKRDYQSGTNRICIYDRLGSDVAITISAAAICPLTL